MSDGESIPGKVPSKEDILAAHDRIRQHIHRTPVMTCAAIDKMVGARLFFKCENLQRTGSFKIRGAGNAVLSLSEEQLAKGVATHSSGNHAQALALAAKLRGVKAYVVMPRTSSRVKVEAVKGYGAEIIFCEPLQAARERTLFDVLRKTGALFIHPYDSPAVIAGQATAAKELLEDAPELDIIIAPVGGGGLLSGTSLSARHFATAKTYGAEPSGADDARRSLAAGRLLPQTNPRTMADGLLTSLSPLTFEIIRNNAVGIGTASEERIADAMRLFHSRMKLVVEPSGAVPLAAILDRRFDIQGKKVGVIISGGNVDPELLRKIF